MALPYEIFIGLRYLRAKRRNRTISFNTIVSIAGITLGVAALIGTVGIMTGFKEDVQAKILGTTAHILVNDRMKESMSEYEEQVKKVAAKKVVAPAHHHDAAAAHHHDAAKKIHKAAKKVTKKDNKKGGKKGSSIKARKGAESLLVQLAARTKKPFMPPKNEDPLTEQALLDRVAVACPDKAADDRACIAGFVERL